MKKSQPAYLMTGKEQGQLSRKRSLENEKLSNQYTARNLWDRTTHPVLKEKQKDIHYKRTGAKDLRGISGY